MSEGIIKMLEYPADSEIFDNLGVSPVISRENDLWKRSISHSRGKEDLFLSYDETGFICWKVYFEKRLILSSSRDQARLITVWSKSGEAYIAVDFEGELGRGRVTLRLYPDIYIEDFQRL
ncbi:hypothetical protein [Mycobacteroides saopaulense]|uniref:hypothetical protein n=1 Tax=Mycobacteroides saopaulense TaxID=1578165 RepID=UPI0010421390|nr:hypothetical protein [Mycobacteroides saopaulense]